LIRPLSNIDEITWACGESQFASNSIWFWWLLIFSLQNLFTILTLSHQIRKDEIKWHSLTSYDITNVDAGHYCATFYGERRVWRCTLKEASGTDQRLELRISTNFPTHQLFRMPKHWKTVENLTDGVWQAQVDRISRTCCKQESIVRNFRIYFCASETAKFGGWLKMSIFTVNYRTKVNSSRSFSKVIIWQPRVMW